MLFDLHIFKGGVNPRAQPHTQSLFLFPIAFGINSNLISNFSQSLPTKIEEQQLAEVRSLAGLHCVCSSDPAVSSELFLSAKSERTPNVSTRAHDNMTFSHFLSFRGENDVILHILWLNICRKTQLVGRNFQFFTVIFAIFFSQHLKERNQVGFSLAGKRSTTVVALFDRMIIRMIPMIR